MADEAMERAWRRDQVTERLCEEAGSAAEALAAHLGEGLALAADALLFADACRELKAQRVRAWD